MGRRTKISFELFIGNKFLLFRAKLMKRLLNPKALTMLFLISPNKIMINVALLLPFATVQMPIGIRCYASEMLGMIFASSRIFFTCLGSSFAHGILPFAFLRIGIAFMRVALFLEFMTRSLEFMTRSR
jgi:hypothetical protein